MIEQFLNLLRPYPFSEFVILSLLLFAFLMFVFFVLPKWGKAMVRGIDKAFGDKPTTPYNYREEELWEPPAHWKMWKETGVYKKPEPNEQPGT